MFNSLSFAQADNFMPGNISDIWSVLQNPDRILDSPFLSANNVKLGQLSVSVSKISIDPLGVDVHLELNV